MYCPKCHQNFEEGSRRFCPTDGARLISDTEPAVGSKDVGIFASLIPKMDLHSDHDEALPNSPRFPVSERPTLVKQAPVMSKDDDIFFEFDDMGPVPNRFDSVQKPKTPVSPVDPPKAPVFEEPTVLRPVDSPPISRPEQPTVLRPEPPQFSQAEQPTVLRPDTPARKVNLYDIPAGHVELDDADRPLLFGAEVDEDNPDSFVGRVVKGRYEVTEFLGDDETGLAYLADDRIVGDKKVLVRILLGGETDEIMDSILAEERISLSHFSHPNIARLIDSGQFTNGTNFLISEFIDALSVAEIMEIHGCIDDLRAARIVRQAAGALNEAHQEGIIHRDVRPENLIISADGDAEQTKLVNFGVSDGEPTVQNLVYKAPEVLDGRIPTTASDVYSLAVTAYQMVTGRLPFAGETAKQLIRSQFNGLVTMPSDVQRGLPTSVDVVLSRALSFNGGDRYPKARDFGDAFYSALADAQAPEAEEDTAPAPVVDDKHVVLEPLSPTPADAAPAAAAIVNPKTKVAEPAWKNRSPEPPQEGNTSSRIVMAVGLLLLLGLLIFGTYYMYNHNGEGENPVQTAPAPPANNVNAPSPISSSTEMPPFPRTVPQPPNTQFYQNSKQNLKGDLLLNFVGFTMYYPKDWKVNGPQVGTSPNARGKFIDISKLTPDGQLKEQMLVSYYPSKGTYSTDAEKFPQMIRETNETLKKILPGYQMVSEGEIKLNGDWRAYEVKFQGSGNSPSGERLLVWGRRIFVPAARPGIRNGFEITLIATSLADDVKSVDDVGVRGELSPILFSFEPGQNF